MDIKIAYDYLNFWINKSQGSYYSPEELDLIVDRAQMSYYDSLRDQYGISQILTDALAFFKTKYAFTNATSPNGLITTPDDYQNLITIHLNLLLPNGKKKRPVVPLLNDDEIDDRFNSQVIEMSQENPFCEQIENWNFQLYPMQPALGEVVYFRRPAVPKFGYTLVGRKPVYDPLTSTQLEWADSDINAILLLALSSIGINIPDEKISQWSEAKIQQTVSSPVKT